MFIRSECVSKVDCLLNHSKRLLYLGLVTCLAGLGLGDAALAQSSRRSANVPAARPSPTVPDELLVGFHGGVDPASAQAMHMSVGATLLDEFHQINVHRVRVPAAARNAVQQALSRHPNVKFVEPNVLAESGYTPNDTSYRDQWHLPQIAAPTGWDISLGSTQILMAVIDSGVDPRHPDLAGKLVPGYSFLTNTTDTHDVQGHGTAVSGTIGAATGNITGVAGVAAQNPILPLVVVNSTNYATYANIALAITYAADHGARVMNLSIGGSTYSSTLQSAVDYAWGKGAVIVASAMNNASSTPMYPAALNHVIAVSATDSNDQLTSFSNYGSWITLAAPGIHILTTTNGGGYGSWYGTSFASPIVAGVAALVLSVQPALTNTQVVDLLKKNSDDLGAIGYDQYFGYGRVNVYKALTAARAATPFVDTTAPMITSITPTDGSTISGTVTIAVAAKDDVGIAKVELYIDGSFKGTDTSGPYTFSWNTKRVKTGPHKFVAKAYDAQGNVSSATVTVYK